MADSIAKTIRDLARDRETVTPQEVHEYLQRERTGEGPVYASVTREFSVCHQVGLIECVSVEPDGAGHRRHYQLVAPPDDNRWTFPADELFDTA